MQYVCLVYIDPVVFAAMSEQESMTLDERSVANNEELRSSGHLIVAQALDSVATATTVRIRDGEVSTTMGPFAETTEHLGGFVYVEARDLNEAIGIAARLPIARYGCIEVRPIFDVEARIRERAAR